MEARITLIVIVLVLLGVSIYFSFTSRKKVEKMRAVVQLQLHGNVSEKAAVNFSPAASQDQHGGGRPDGHHRAVEQFVLESDHRDKEGAASAEVVSGGFQLGDEQDKSIEDNYDIPTGVGKINDGKRLFENA
jgi:hypothetical protein